MLPSFIGICKNSLIMLFDGAERLGRNPDIYNDLGTFSSEELFECLDARLWIERYRVEYGDGSVDMFGTIEKVGIPLASPDEEYAFDPIIIKAYTSGVSVDANEPIRIHISPRHMDDEARLSLGHELGHFFLFQHGYLHDDSDLKPVVEQFCDVFGREFALPVEYLESVDGVDGAVISSLMEIFKVSYETVFMQLMKAEKLPKAVLVDTSFGETPNPAYNNRLTRIAVCYDCEMGTPHTVNYDAVPIIDMSYDPMVFRSMPLTSCSYVSPLNIALIEAVEREHGRI